MEDITGKSVTINIDGLNEQQVDAAMAEAFGFASRQLQAGKWKGSRIMNGAKVSYCVTEERIGKA